MPRLTRGRTVLRRQAFGSAFEGLAGRGRTMHAGSPPGELRGALPGHRVEGGVSPASGWKTDSRSPAPTVHAERPPGRTAPLRPITRSEDARRLAFGPARAMLAGYCSKRAASRGLRVARCFAGGTAGRRVSRSSVFGPDGRRPPIGRPCGRAESMGHAASGSRGAASDDHPVRGCFVGWL